MTIQLWLAPLCPSRGFQAGTSKAGLQARGGMRYSSSTGLQDFSQQDKQIMNTALSINLSSILLCARGVAASALLLALATPCLGAQVDWTRIWTPGPLQAYAGHAYDIGRDRMILFGGRNGPNFFNNTWEWNGTKWAQSFPNTSPTARARSAMVYDEARSVVLLFGGMTSRGMLNDTWTYDGKDWKKLKPKNSPTVRGGASMSYDSDRKLVVLFGGFVPSGKDSNETWEWDGTDWSKKSPAKLPRARGAHIVCYDRTRKLTLLYGGYSSSFKNTIAETWTWNGTTWKEHFLAINPGPLCDQAMDYDVARNRVVFFGGLKINGPNQSVFGNTWDWDGAKWLRRAPRTKPQKRAKGHTVYDVKRRRFMMFGGDTLNSIINDTWFLAPTQPASLTEYGAGCTGGGGVPRLSGDIEKLPWMAAQFDLNITKAATSAQVAILILGSSDSKWGNFNLPLDLTPFGGTGCKLNASFELMLPVLLSSGNGTLKAVMCDCLQIVGIPFYMQAMVLDTSVSRPLKVAMSNGLKGVAGSR